MPAHRNSVSKPEEDGSETSGYQRRARGEIACAECRRLKMKCDRRVPCSPCKRRGCASICPHGTLKAGLGTRFILSNTEELHERLNEMSERIRVLENALQTEYARNHPEGTHSLLSERKLLIKDFLRPRDQPDPTGGTAEDGGNNDDSSLDTPAEAPGTLAIGPDGSMRYFGRTAGTEVVFMGNRADDLDGLDEPGVPEHIRDLSEGFPFPRRKNRSMTATINTLKSLIPPYERAMSLIKYHLKYITFFFRPLKPEELYQRVIDPIYKCLAESQGVDGFTTQIHPHLLGLMFTTMAIGAICDPNLPSRNSEAELYFHAAKAALSLKPLFVDTTLDTIMAMGYIFAYLNITEQSRAAMSSHLYLSLTCMLAQNLGLHRDPARWGLPPDVVDVRRRVFWALNNFEHMHATLTGAATFFASGRVDCEMPMDDEQLFDNEGKPHPGFWLKRAMLIRDIYAPLNLLMTSVKLPNYETVLEFDRKIRTFYPPIPSSKLASQPDWMEKEMAAFKRGNFNLEMSRYWLLLYLHRTFFARCCQEHPVYPVQSPYAASYFTACRSSLALLQMIRRSAEWQFDYIARFPHCWTIAFSAAVILGSAIVRGPNNSFAAPGLAELGQAIVIFEKTAKTLKRPRTALPYLKTLLRKAHHAYTEFNQRGLISPPPPEEGDQETNLAMFSGQPVVFVSDLSLASSPSPPNLATLGEPFTSPTSADAKRPDCYDEQPGDQPPLNTIPPVLVNIPPEMAWMLSPEDRARTTFAAPGTILSLSTEMVGATSVEVDPGWGMGNLMSAVDSSTGMQPGDLSSSIANGAGTATGVYVRSEDAVNLFGLEPVSGHEADESWASFVRDTGLLWDGHPLDGQFAGF